MSGPKRPASNSCGSPCQCKFGKLWPIQVTFRMRTEIIYFFNFALHFFYSSKDKQKVAAAPPSQPAVMSPTQVLNSDDYWCIWRCRFFLKFWSQPGACTPPVHPFSTANSHQCRLSGKLLFVLVEPPHTLFVFYIQQTFVWNYIESHYVLSKLMLNILLCIAQKTNTNFGNIWPVKMRMMFFQMYRQ